MDIQVELDGTICIVAALICLTLPMPWVISILAASAIHELSHILAVMLVGGKIYKLRIKGNGTIIDASSMSEFSQLFCILCGPASSMLLLLTANIYPKLAACGFVQGMFNLLPLYPLDGGRALRCISQKLFSQITADRIYSLTEKIIVLILITITTLSIACKKFGIAPAFVLLLLLYRIRS